jgi:hypothetical protein
MESGGKQGTQVGAKTEIYLGLLTLAMGVTLIAQAFRVRGHRTGDGSRVV